MSGAPQTSVVRSAQGEGARRTALYALCREEERHADRQLAELQEVAAAQGGDCEWYTDWLGTPETSHRSGGRDTGRPAFGGLLEDLAKGRVCWLVIWRLDKLALGTDELAGLLGELGDRGAGLTSLRDGLCLEPETLVEAPALLLAVLACERCLLGASTALGMERARKEGRRCGGSSPGPRTVTEQQRAQVAALAAEGRPKAYIARVVGLSRDTVYRLLGAAGRLRKPKRRPP